MRSKGYLCSFCVWFLGYLLDFGTNLAFNHRDSRDLLMFDVISDASAVTNFLE